MTPLERTMMFAQWWVRRALVHDEPWNPHAATRWALAACEAAAVVYMRTHASDVKTALEIVQPLIQCVENTARFEHDYYGGADGNPHR